MQFLRPLNRSFTTKPACLQARKSTKTRVIGPLLAIDLTEDDIDRS